MSTKRNKDKGLSCICLIHMQKTNTRILLLTFSFIAKQSMNEIGNYCVAVESEKYFQWGIGQGPLLYLLRASPNDWIWSQWYNTDKKERIYNDDLLIDTLWYYLSYDLDVQSDFGKLFVRKKLVRWNHSCIKYALIHMQKKNPGKKWQWLQK